MSFYLDIPNSVFICLASMLAICTAGSAYMSRSKRKAIQRRAQLTLKHNAIELQSGEIFAGSFSSESRLLVDREELRKVVHAVASRQSYTRGRFASLREAAHVRIYPGASGITDLEIEAVYQTLMEEFIDVEIVVAEAADDVHSTDSAVMV